MSKKIIIAVGVIILLAGVGFVLAQEGMRGPRGRGGPQGGRPPFDPMGEWIENLSKAYEQTVRIQSRIRDSSFK